MKLWPPIVMADIGMAYEVMAYVVMAYMVMAYIAMAQARRRRLGTLEAGGKLR